MRALLVILLLTSISLAADPSTAPTTQPVTKYTLLKGAIEYQVPSDWKRSEKDATDEAAPFYGGHLHAFMAVIVQKEGLPMTDQLAIALRKSIIEQHKKEGVKMIKEPKIQKDSRFEVRIYEEYEKDGKQIAQLHLYRQRGKRPVSVKVTLMNVPEAEQKQFFKDGEETLLSVKWVKK